MIMRVWYRYRAVFGFQVSSFLARKMEYDVKIETLADSPKSCLMTGLVTSGKADLQQHLEYTSHMKLELLMSGI